MAMAQTLAPGDTAYTAGVSCKQCDDADGAVRAQTIRERLLAMLAAFFAVVALLLASDWIWSAELFRAAAGSGNLGFGLLLALKLEVSPG